jgi:hypothetical protein
MVKTSRDSRALDEGKLRAMHLAGTVAFPLRYSVTGNIWLERRTLPYRSTPQEVDLVYVHEKGAHDQDATRFALNSHVEAIFFPGAKEGRGRNAAFHFADNAYDLDKGFWFLGPDVNGETISKVLEIDIYQRDSGAKGIIFVPENRAVYSMDEFAETAEKVMLVRGTCDPGHRP